MSQPFTGPAGVGRLLDIDPDDFASIERDGASVSQRLYKGCRAAFLGPDPRDPARGVVAIEGGVAPPADGHIEDSVLFTLSPEALDALAAGLREAASDLRRSRVIDMRYIV